MGETKTRTLEAATHPTTENLPGVESEIRASIMADQLGATLLMAMQNSATNGLDYNLDRA